MVRCANVLCDDLNDKAMAIHLQRVVGSFVGSAFGAATFYQTKLTAARDLTMASQNDDRDEDRDGVSGFESKGERARLFAAQMGLQAYALMAAAEGAVHAYAPHHRRRVEGLRGTRLRPQQHQPPVGRRGVERLRITTTGGGRKAPASPIRLKRGEGGQARPDQTRATRALRASGPREAEPRF